MLPQGCGENTARLEKEFERLTRYRRALEDVVKAARGAMEEGLISCNMGFCYSCELKDALKEIEKYEK